MKGLIDVHHHILPEAYVAAVGREKIGAQGSSGRCPHWSTKDALARMDAAGISTAITSISAPGLDVSDPGQEPELARMCNEFAAALCRSHPRRFGFFATLPLGSTDGALKEVAHSYDTLQADGVCLLSNYRGIYPGEATYAPLYEELNARRAVVFLHPTSPSHPVSVAGLSASSLDFTFDTARAMASLIFSGTLQRYPNIRFIFSHMGGAMPYIAERIGVLARNNPKLQAYIPEGIAAELNKCYYDTALSANRSTLATMCALASPSRMLFGTDYPFGPANQVEDARKSLDALPLGEAELQGIKHGTASGLFPRFA